MSGIEQSHTMKLQWVKLNKYEMPCAIWYHFYNLKNAKNTYKGTCNFTKNNTPPWVFFTFFKLYKWYQIAQSITYSSLIAQLLNCFWQEIEQSLLAYWYNLICTFFRCDSSPQWTVVLILKWVSVCILVFACLLNFTYL